MAKSGVYNFSHAELDDLEYAGPIRYFSQEEIEEISPSRRDGIDLKKERSLQASYCKFLQKLGMQLKVSQITISSAMAYCHRFYLQQSHAKNDRMTIATACMFIAAKVGESFRPLRDIVPVAYEIINRKDLLAVWKIKQKKVYERQKELILLAERVVLVALAFNFSVSLPYRPLLKAVRKFNGADNFFVQVAWNFVNDCFQTSLCLQRKAQHIAAGAFFLAAKFTKVKLPFEGAFWSQEFNITSQQLEEITSQMMDLYVARGPLAIEFDGSTGNDHITTSSTAGGNLVYDSGHSQAPSPKLRHLLGSGLPDA